jgi:hypothetical protein
MADKVPYQGVTQEAFSFWAKPVLKDSTGKLYCPGFEGATYLQNEYDFLVFGTKSDASGYGPQGFSSTTPGKATIKITKFRDVDKKKQAGSDGARITVHGVEPAEVDIELLIWTPEQLKALNALWPIIFPRAYKDQVDAFDVSHPILQLHDVKSLIFTAGSGPDIDKDRVGHFTMRAVEFLLPKKKSVTTLKASKPLKTLLDKKGSAPASNTSEPSKYPTAGSNSKNTGP